MNKYFRVSMMLFFAFCVGCSTFSRKDCEVMDWTAQGYKSAISGQSTAGPIAYFQRECGQENGIQPDTRLFNIGYEQGLKVFCSPEGGQLFGRSGGLYENTCPPNLEKLFLEKYQLGRIEYTGSRIQQLENEVYNLRNEISLKDQRISELEARINILTQSR